MNEEKCFCHFNGYKVKDATARNDIEKIKENLNKINPDLEKVIDKVREPKYIFVGDSYLEGWTPEGAVESWGVKVANILGLKASQYQIVDYGGSGFTREDTKTFTQMISELASDEEVTDVIVCGGYNDQNASEESILAGMSSFKTTCKSKFPNAKISIGHIGWTKTPEIIYHLHVNIARYKKCASKLGLRYLSNVEYALKKYFTDFSSDEIHPNELGETSIAEAISSAIISGQANIQLPFKNISFNAKDGWGIQNNGNFGCSVNNGITSIYCQDVINIECGENVFTLNANNSLIEIGTITDGYVIGGYTEHLSLPVNCVIGYSGGYASVPGKLVINRGKLYLRLYNTNQYTGANAFGTLSGAYLLQIQCSGVSVDTSLC